MEVQVGIHDYINLCSLRTFSEHSTDPGYGHSEERKTPGHITKFIVSTRVLRIKAVFFMICLEGHAMPWARVGVSLLNG
jgi:hypothetical protein